jgi:hypothetical protein
MVEVRRDLFMDEETGKKRPDFDDVARRVQEAVRELTAPR